tara:strand:- start:11097 stop:11261 length:165 start_codon:yes stop_codon:yes gene_type:complete
MAIPISFSVLIWFFNFLASLNLSDSYWVGGYSKGVKTITKIVSIEAKAPIPNAQ